MKSLIISIFAAVLLCSCNSNETTSFYLMHTPFKGKVKSVEQRMYKAESKFGEVQKGKVVDVSPFENNFKADFMFDDKANVTITFSDLGHQTEEKYPDYSNSKYISTYDKEKRVITTKAYDKRGKEVGDRYIIKCDDDNRVISELYYDSEGKENNTTVLFYNSDGLVQKRETRNPKKELKSIVDNTFDSDNNLIKQVVYDEDNKQEYKALYQFRDGNKEHIEFFNESDSLLVKLHYTYEFDDQGNWIKEILSDSNGKPEMITERTIKYYDDEPKPIAVQEIEKPKKITKSSDTFEGFWVYIENERITMNITKNGNNYIVEEQTGNKYPAFVHNGLLEISGDFSVKALVDNQGHLIIKGREYIKQ